MGTAKRERQKANKAKKIEDQRKQEQRDLTKDRGLVIALIAVAVVAALGLWVLFGNDDSDAETTEILTEEPAVPVQPLPTAIADPTVEDEQTTETDDDAEESEEEAEQDEVEEAETDEVEEAEVDEVSDAEEQE